MPSQEQISLNASQETVFKSTMEILSQRHSKALSANPNSDITAEIGSLNSFSLAQARGRVEISIVPENDRSRVNMKFDFTKDYVADMSIVILGDACILGFLWWLNHLSLLQKGFFQSWFFVMVVSICLIFPISAIALAKYSTSLTKRKIKEEIEGHLGVNFSQAER